MTSRSETVAVAVVVWKELLQDMTLSVPDHFQQTFVDVLDELGRNRVTVAIQAKWTNVSMHCLSEVDFPLQHLLYGKSISHKFGGVWLKHLHLKLLK